MGHVRALITIEAGAGQGGHLAGPVDAGIPRQGQCIATGDELAPVPDRRTQRRVQLLEHRLIDIDSVQQRLQWRVVRQHDPNRLHRRILFQITEIVAGILIHLRRREQCRVEVA